MEGQLVITHDHNQLTISDFIRLSRLGVRKFLVTMESFFKELFCLLQAFAVSFYKFEACFTCRRRGQSQMCGLGQIKRLKSQIPRSFSSFMTSNFSISVRDWSLLMPGTGAEGI